MAEVQNVKVELSGEGLDALIAKIDELKESVDRLSRQTSQAISRGATDRGRR